MKPIVFLGCPPQERLETEKALGAADVSVVWADSVQLALAELQRRDIPVLLDLSRGAAALQSVRDIRSQRASALLFAVVDSRRPDLTIEAVLAGMADVFARPLSGRRVANAIERELSVDARHRGVNAQASGDDLYAHSEAMRAVSAVIERASTMRAGVLIRGEDGTGRQLAARAIHTAQNGAHGAFVAVNCAAFETEQLDVELFGGAPPGRTTARMVREVWSASAARVACTRPRAAPSTSRISPTPPPAFRRGSPGVLRDREARLVETGETIGFDVRPMAGVEPGFEASVQDGRVREDLFRRVSAIAFDMPPLRNRREDIPALVNCFVRQICASLGVPPKTLSRPALSLISALPWRGNAPEMRALIKNIVVGLQGGRGIGLDDVLVHVKLDAGSVVFANGGTLKEARARFERDYIVAILEQHHGRISDAARALGIQRTNLYRKMRSLRVHRDRRQ